MKCTQNLSHKRFLQLLFSFLTGFLFLAAVLMPDRKEMFSGLWQIVSNPSKVCTNYFYVGGYAATFLNSALVSLFCTLIFSLPKSKPNQKTVLAFLLVLGFTTWGINIFNIIPTVAGVLLYCLVKKQNPGTQVNAMFFSTGAAPLITDLLIRYPHPEVVGFTLPGVLLGTAVGLLIGFTLPAGITYSPNVHKDFDLYSAALPLGLMSFLLQAVFFETLGVPVPTPPGKETLAVASPLIVNGFCSILFAICILTAIFVYRVPIRTYWKLMDDESYKIDYITAYGQGPMLLNMGVYGFFVLAFYNLIGAPMNGVTFGCIFCMLSCCDCGSNPRTVWPIFLGYVLASFGLGWLSSLVGGEFRNLINAQTMVVGACFATGLSPIVGRYGPIYGIIGAVLHSCLVTCVPTLHGGFCLYNGGFTAAFVCLAMVPQLERFCKTRMERRAKKQA